MLRMSKSSFVCIRLKVTLRVRVRVRDQVRVRVEGHEGIRLGHFAASVTLME